MKEMFTSELRDKTLIQKINRHGIITVKHYQDEVFYLVSPAKYRKIMGIEEPAAPQVPPVPTKPKAPKAPKKAKKSKKR